MILSAKKISKKYPGLTLLEEISLELNRGESIAIVGPSGVGKSTLLNILGTLDEPDSGEITLCNTLLSPASYGKLRRNSIGFIFQSFNLLEEYSTLENVLMPAKIARKKVSKEYGLTLLEKVGLKDKADKSAKILSGGEKQRVAIARALCNNPDIIFADEPTGNLDHETSKLIHSLLFSCSKDKGLIIVTHDAELANQCDKKLHLSDGALTCV